MHFEFKQRVFVCNIAMIFVVIVSFFITNLRFSDKYPEFIAVLWFIFITIWLFILAFSYMHYKYELGIFLLSYFIKIFYFCYLIRGNDIQNPQLSDDASGFWRVANQYYEGNFSRVYTKLPYILNSEFQVFGANYFCCILVNIALSMITIIITANLLKKFSLSLKTNVVLLCLISLFPYSFILSTSLWREPIYLLCLAASFTVFCNYIFTKKRNSFYISIILLMPVLFMHIGYFPIVIVYFYISFKIQKVKTKKEFIKILMQIIVLFLSCMIITGFDSVKYIVGSGSGGIEGALEKLTDDGAGASQAGSAYLTNIRVNTLGQVIMYAPLQWFYYSFSPLMTNWRGVSDIVTFFGDSLIHMYFYISSILICRRYKVYLGYKHTTLEKKYRIIVTGILSVFLCGIIFGQGTSTAGTAIRHRDVLLGIEIMTLGAALSLKNDLRYNNISNEADNNLSVG